MPPCSERIVASLDQINRVYYRATRTLLLKQVVMHGHGGLKSREISHAFPNDAIRDRAAVIQILGMGGAERESQGRRGMSGWEGGLYMWKVKPGVDMHVVVIAVAVTAVRELLCKSLCSSCYIRVSCRECTLLDNDSATKYCMCATSKPTMVVCMVAA